MHRENTLKQPCYRCEACKSGKPRECIRLKPSNPEQFQREPHMDEQTDWPDSRKYMGTCQRCARTFRGDKGRVEDRKCWNCAKPQSEPVAGMAIPEPQRPVGGSLMPHTTIQTPSEPLMAFFAACDPTDSTAQQKGVRIVNGKPMFFTKAKVKKAEQQIARLFAPYVPPAPLEGPLVVEVEFIYPWRKGEAKSVKGYWKCRPKDTKPDVENAFKSVGDQMTKLKFWGDDSQIARLVLVKVWADEPGIRVNIRQANPVYR